MNSLKNLVSQDQTLRLNDLLDPEPYSTYPLEVNQMLNEFVKSNSQKEECARISENQIKVKISTKKQENFSLHDKVTVSPDSNVEPTKETEQHLNDLDEILVLRTQSPVDDSKTSQVYLDQEILKKNGHKQLNQ